MFSRPSTKLLQLCALLSIVAATWAAAGGDLQKYDALLADIHDYPFVVSVVVAEQYYGVAIIISKNVLFTEDTPYDVSQVVFRAGSANWSTGGQVIRAKEKIEYRYYMFFVLDRDLQFGPTIAAVPYPTRPTYEPGTRVEVVGWGHLAVDKLAEDLLSLSTEILQHDTCLAAYTEIFSEVPEEFPLFCVAHKQGPGLFDDSDAVLVYNGTFHGIFIFRDYNEEMDHPALFLHISYFARTMQRVIYDNA